MDLVPIVALWSGLYLDGTIIVEDDMQYYVDDALNELEFLMVILHGTPHRHFKITYG